MESDPEELSEEYTDCIVLESQYNSALIGYGKQFNTNVAIYNEQKVIELIKENTEMFDDEAREYFEFNILGS